VDAVLECPDKSGRYPKGGSALVSEKIRRILEEHQHTIFNVVYHITGNYHDEEIRSLNTKGWPSIPGSAYR
jgi:hypothetical protein